MQWAPQALISLGASERTALQGLRHPIAPQPAPQWAGHMALLTPDESAAVCNRSTHTHRAPCVTWAKRSTMFFWKWLHLVWDLNAGFGGIYLFFPVFSCPRQHICSCERLMTPFAKQTFSWEPSFNGLHCNDLDFAFPPPRWWMESQVLESLQWARRRKHSQIHQHSSLATDLFPSVTSAWLRSRREPTYRWNPTHHFGVFTHHLPDHVLRIVSTVSRSERLSLRSVGIWPRLSGRTGILKILTSSNLLTSVCL